MIASNKLYLKIALCIFSEFSLFIFVILNVGLTKVYGLPTKLKIGAIFPESERHSTTELAFKYAVYAINRDKGLLPATNLLYDIQYANEWDSFHACKKVCDQISYGVQAIFGPSNSFISSHVHSICDALDLPHLEVHIETDNEVAINLHPYRNYVNDAFLDAIYYLNWTKVGILHEKHYGRIQLRRLIRIPLEVHIRHVQPDNYLTTLNEMKEKEIHNLIIDTNSEFIQILLKGILRLQMNEYKYHYLFTTFDIELFDLEDFKYNFVNITSYRLVDVNDVAVKEILKDMETFKYKNNLSSTSEMNSNYKHEDNSAFSENYRKRRTIGAAPALVFDSVFIFAVGLQTLEQSHALTLKNMTCMEAKPWDGGLSLINYINSVEWRGLTGPIQFKEGRRVQFKVDLVKLKQHSIVKVGEWSPHSRLNITEPSLFFDAGSMNVTLVVITILETPYVMMHYGKNFTGNERFFGFCVDVLELVARDVGFDYILDLVPDRKYGAKNSQTGEWNGMVAQLMKYKADLAVAPMTITHARESVIDFTKPFMNLGISILFKVPTTPPTRLFSFMNPLAFDIWLYVLAAYFIVSFTIYIVAKFSPVEHCQNRHHVCIKSKTADFSLSNCFWFTIGTLMQQGSDLSPRAFSTRIVSAIWWFFTLIIIASYTANLAAFLTVERMITPIENAEDLASQTEISYGTLDSGSTMTFFRDSLIETYRKMWRNMDNKKKPSALTSTYEEGIKRVKESNYAFLMESTMLDYIVQRDCNLTQIGGLLDTKGYGIATPKASPWRDKISLAILELQEKGDIQMLYDKWWKNTGDTCVRNRNNKKSKANALGLDNIGGVFVVLIIGIGVAICVAMFEFWQHYKCQRQESENFKDMNTNKDTQRRMQLSAAMEDGDDDADADDDDDHNNKKQTIAIKNQKYHWRPHQYDAQQQRSLWIEMLDEFIYALRCMDKRKRPSLKRRCSQCHLLKNVPSNDMLLTTVNKKQGKQYKVKTVS